MFLIYKKVIWNEKCNFIAAMAIRWNAILISLDRCSEAHMIYIVQLFLNPANTFIYTYAYTIEMYRVGQKRDTPKLLFTNVGYALFAAYICERELAYVF